MIMFLLLLNTSINNEPSSSVAMSHTQSTVEFFLLRYGVAVRTLDSHLQQPQKTRFA